MEFRYSDELSRTDNPTGGLAGSIPLRRHRWPAGEDRGAMRAQKDWKTFVGPVKNFKGCLCPRYSLTQVAIPECRPERLEVIAYATEIGFLYDDCTEFLDQQEINRANDSMQSAFTEGVRNGQIVSAAGGLKALQAKLLTQMVAIDKTRALVAMKVWNEFLQESAGRQHNIPYTTFEGYMQYRMLDVGETFWFGLVTFGMALTIPRSEVPMLRELTRPCWIVLALQNDLCSYDKECEAARMKGTSRIVNVLPVLMHQRSIDLEDAIRVCRQLIDSNVVKYQDIVAIHRNNLGLSKDMRVYMESLLYTISGDAAWSLVTPRYNSSRHHTNLNPDAVNYGAKTVLAGSQEQIATSSSLVQEGMKAGSVTVQVTEAKHVADEIHHW